MDPLVMGLLVVDRWGAEPLDTLRMIAGARWGTVRITGAGKPEGGQSRESARRKVRTQPKSDAGLCASASDSAASSVDQGVTEVQAMPPSAGVPMLSLEVWTL